MNPSPKRPIVVLRTSGANRGRLGSLARWVRALLPAAVLIVAPVGGEGTIGSDDAIALDGDALPSGPLSLADAIARAAASTQRKAT